MWCDTAVTPPTWSVRWRTSRSPAARRWGSAAPMWTCPTETVRNANVETPWPLARKCKFNAFLYYMFLKPFSYFQKFGDTIQFFQVLSFLDHKRGRKEQEYQGGVQIRQEDIWRWSSMHHWVHRSTPSNDNGPYNNKFHRFLQLTVQYICMGWKKCGNFHKNKTWSKT